MTTGQGGYSSCNHFAGFTNNTGEDDILDNDTAKTIAKTINSPPTANLSAQTAASLKANAMQINASLQQLANNNMQLHQQQQSLMQQMTMLTTNATTTRNNTYVARPTQIYAPPPLHGFQQQSYYPHRGDGCGGGLSRGGRARHACGGGGHGTPMPPPVPYVGTNIPYIPVGANPPLGNVTRISPTSSKHMPIRMCATCAVLMWKIGSRVPRATKKPGNQDGFPRSNYMEYERTNHPFSQKAMHKTMYPSSF